MTKTTRITALIMVLIIISSSAALAVAPKKPAYTEAYDQYNLRGKSAPGLISSGINGIKSLFNGQAPATSGGTVEGIPTFNKYTSSSSNDLFYLPSNIDIKSLPVKYQTGYVKDDIIYTNDVRANSATVGFIPVTAKTITTTPNPVGGAPVFVEVVNGKGTIIPKTKENEISDGITKIFDSNANNNVFTNNNKIATLQTALQSIKSERDNLKQQLDSMDTKSDAYTSKQQQLVILELSITTAESSIKTAEDNNKNPQTQLTADIDVSDAKEKVVDLLTYLGVAKKVINPSDLNYYGKDMNVAYFGSQQIVSTSDIKSSEIVSGGITKSFYKVIGPNGESVDRVIIYNPANGQTQEMELVTPKSKEGDATTTKPYYQSLSGGILANGITQSTLKDLNGKIIGTDFVSSDGKTVYPRGKTGYGAPGTDIDTTKPIYMCGGVTCPTGATTTGPSGVPASLQGTPQTSSGQIEKVAYYYKPGVGYVHDEPKQYKDDKNTPQNGIERTVLGPENKVLYTAVMDPNTGNVVSSTGLSSSVTFGFGGSVFRYANNGKGELVETIPKYQTDSDGSYKIDSSGNKIIDNDKSINLVTRNGQQIPLTEGDQTRLIAKIEDSPLAVKYKTEINSEGKEVKVAEFSWGNAAGLTFGAMDSMIQSGVAFGQIYSLFNGGNAVDEDFRKNFGKDLSQFFSIDNFIAENLCEVATDQDSIVTAAYFQDGTIGMHLEGYKTRYNQTTISCDIDKDCKDVFKTNNTKCGKDEDVRGLCVDSAKNTPMIFTGFLYKINLFVSPSQDVLKKGTTLEFDLNLEGVTREKVDINGNNNLNDDVVKLKVGSEPYKLAGASGVVLLKQKDFSSVCMYIKDTSVFTPDFERVYDKVGKGEKFCNSFVREENKAGSNVGPGIFGFGLAGSKSIAETQPGSAGSSSPSNSGSAESSENRPMPR